MRVRKIFDGRLEAEYHAADTIPAYRERASREMGEPLVEPGPD